MSPHPFHLARRFAGSLRPGPPAPGDEQWARAQLGPGEQELWARMSNPDRRHAAAVARAVEAGLAELSPGPAVRSAQREILAAALLHDVGKVASGLGTFSRVGATLVWAMADRPPVRGTRPRRWAGSHRPVARRLGQYRLHPELGAALLTDAGAAPLTVAWAREHHQPPSTWTIPGPVAKLLKACDDD